MASTAFVDTDAGNVLREASLLGLLPTELILKVFDVLDFRTLLLCQRVCRLFRDIITKTAIFQYKIELGANGMEDGPPGGLNVAARLARLQRRQAAWEDLKWTEDKSIKMLTGHIWELYGGVLAQATGKDSLMFRQLPSHYRNIEEKTWTVDISQFDARDFTFDPSQDLLVVVEKPRQFTSNQEMRWRHSVQLRHLSTGAAHHLASTPANLIHTLDGDVDPVSFSLQISGQYLGVLFISGGEGEGELVIWDWKTGRVQLSLVGVRSGMQIRSFAYLTERHIMVATHVSPKTFELQPNLLVFDLTIGPSTRVAIDNSPFICSFFCPSPGSWTMALDIGIQSDPAPSHMPDPALSVPFFTGRENRIFVVTILLTDGHIIQSFVIFIPSSTLTGHMSTLPSDERRSCVPWEAWGPKGTRMVPSPGHSDVWVCYVNGMRFVALHEFGRTGSTTIWVYDFSPLAIKRAVAAGRESDETISYEYAEKETSLDTSGQFKDIVITSLPYRISRVSLQTNTPDSEFSAVMCSEDNIIVVGTGSGRRRFRIITF